MEQPCHVLFVCLGNICRSPAGENIFRHQVEESGLSDCIACDSAGTAGYHIGKDPDARMTKAMRNRGYQVTGGARQFSPADFDRFDLILTMDDDNYRDIISQARSDDERKRVRCFTDFCTEHDETEVPTHTMGETKDSNSSRISSKTAPPDHRASPKNQRTLKVTFGLICVLPNPGIHRIFRASRRGGRVVECTGLENRRAARYRGFESHPLCHKATSARGGGLMAFCGWT